MGLKRRGRRIGTTREGKNVIPVRRVKVEEIGEIGEIEETGEAETDENVEEAGIEIGETGARVDPVSIVRRKATDEMTADVAGEEENTIVPPTKKVIKITNLKRKQVRKE